MSAPNKQLRPGRGRRARPRRDRAGGRRGAGRHQRRRGPRGAQGGPPGTPGDQQPPRPGQPRDRRAAAGAKAEAGKRVGQARGGVAQALAARQAELEAERDRARPRRGDASTSRSGCRAAASAPGTRCSLQEQIADMFVGMGWEVAEGPEVESEWFNFDALNFDRGPPGPADAGHLLRRPAGSRAGAAHPHLAGPGPHHARARPADLRDLPGQGVPHRRAGRDAHAGLPPDRGSGRSTRA